MWWPITGMLDPAEPSVVMRPPAMETGRFRYRGVPADISVLNRRAEERGDLEITALSMHTYARVHGRYVLTACGASMGYGYGPKVVVREDSRLTAENFIEMLAGEKGGGRRVAVPGMGTTASLVFGLMVGGRGMQRLRAVELPFDRIVEAVRSGEADAGLLIHQSQLTYAEAGLREVADVGAWWEMATGLPLPLGGNAVRRDLDEMYGEGTCREVTRVLEESIRYALSHREESIRYAMRWAPELSLARAERYIDMYVNALTVDMGEEGERAIRRLLAEGARAGLCPEVGEVEVLRGGGVGDGQ